MEYLYFFVFFRKYSFYILKKHFVTASGIPRKILLCEMLLNNITTNTYKNVGFVIVKRFRQKTWYNVTYLNVLNTIVNHVTTRMTKVKEFYFEFQFIAPKKLSQPLRVGAEQLVYYAPATPVAHPPHLRVINGLTATTYETTTIL